MNVTYVVGALNFNRKRDDVILKRSLETNKEPRKEGLNDARYRFITAGSQVRLNLVSKLTFVTVCEGSSLDLHSFVVELEILLK